jgi:hypothetical protein
VKQSPFFIEAGCNEFSQHMLESGTEGEASDHDHDHNAQGGGDTQPAMMYSDNHFLPTKIDEPAEKFDVLTALFMTQQHFSPDSRDDVQL